MLEYAIAVKAILVKTEMPPLQLGPSEGLKTGVFISFVVIVAVVVLEK